MPVFHFHLQVITPVHIGTERTKDYISGLDFMYDKNKGEYQVYSFNKLLPNLEQRQLNAITGYLLGQPDKVSEYISSQRLITQNILCYSWPSAYGTAREIRRHIQDGLGNWIIPGSSLKGSIRSILATYLYRHSGKKGKINLEDLFGKIENNLMRFIQVSDSKMTCSDGSVPVGIYPIKIFSGDLPDKGMWKDARNGGHKAQFSSEHFVSFYEMLNDDYSGTPPAEGRTTIRWGWDGEKAIHLFNARVKNQVKNVDLIFNHEDPKWLIQRIREHTNNFLKKEMAYFRAFPNKYLQEDFFGELERLMKENEKDEKSCLLRVGGNVGWHSITGDWQYDDYVAARKQPNSHRNQLKTRKILFDLTLDENNEEHIRFTLPGFVKLTLEKVE